MQFRSINPYNGQIIETYKGLEANEIESKITKSEEVFRSWRNTSFSHRSELMNVAGEVLLSNKEKYSKTITLEMGKPISESIAEIEKCAKVCSYYAAEAENFLSDQPLNTPHGTGYVHFNPLGVVLSVMPWNFPFWQVFRFAAPALMAGNTGLLKHASNVPGCALHIEEVFQKAGFPEGLFSTLLISSGQVAQVIDHASVVAVTLTGSEYAGGQVAKAAGANIKKSVLELGGSDPFIVLADADIDLAASTAVKGRMINTGQSCIAAKRFIFEKDIATDFTNKFIEALDALKSGDPMEETTDYASLARQDLAEELHEQVVKSVEMGAELIYGKIPKKIDSAFYPHLILGNLKPGMPAYDEELFGPVACFFEVEDVDHAIQIANDSEFGLGGSLWTRNIDLAKDIADRIESGAIYVNQMMFSDPSVPFGGIKKSGFGRELSYLGIREFTNQKTVWIA